MTRAAITAYGSAVPAPIDQTELWEGFFARHYGRNPIAERMFRAVGVQTRHGVVNPVVEDVSSWSTAERMRRYLSEAVPLGKAALAEALAAADLRAEDIGMLVVASCTGYATPGLNVVLPRDMGMAADLRTLLLGHMGCYAALPGLGAATDYVAQHGRPAMVLCVELTSLHLQPSDLPSYTLTSESVQQMVVHALFADAAAAVVVSPAAPGAGGLEVVDITSVTDASTADMMTWEIGDHGFRMGLSPEVPDVVRRQVGPAVEALLAAHQLRADDISAWAVHPGGPAILDATAEALGLSEDAMRPSRDVLRDYGNCSSPTVLLILERLAPSLGTGDYVVALGFGPGLTMYAALLRAG